MLLERGVCSCAELQVLLQRLKGRKKGDKGDFNNIKTQAVIKVLFLQDKALEEIHAILTETLGEHPPSNAIIKNWVAQFKHNFSTSDAPCPGWPKTVTTPVIIVQIHELVLEDCWVLAKSIAEQLGISCGRVGSITHEDLDLQKFSAKWVLKCLNTDEKCQRCQSSE